MEMGGCVDTIQVARARSHSQLGYIYLRLLVLVHVVSSLRITTRWVLTISSRTTAVLDFKSNKYQLKFQYLNLSVITESTICTIACGGLGLLV